MYECLSAKVVLGSVLALAGLTLAFMWTYYGNKLQEYRDGEETEERSECS
jgi:hypothetical protein